MQKGSAEIFFRKVKFWKEDGEEEAPPVFVGISFSINYNQFYTFIVHTKFFAAIKPLFSVKGILDFL